jgi:hypothetical protein
VTCTCGVIFGVCKSAGDTAHAEQYYLLVGRDRGRRAPVGDFDFTGRG